MKGRYKGRYFIREKIYTCGNYVDVDIFPVYQPQGKRREKCRPTNDIQSKLNQKNAERKLVRLIHNNFTEEDVVIHLTYKETPESLESAMNILHNFLRRVKRLRRKLGLEPLKYITATEVGKKSGRIHHHVIMSGGIDRDTLERMWGLGYANSKRLQFNESGIAGLAHYIAKDRLTYRRWNSSKNLISPEPEIRDGSVTVGELSNMEVAFENGMQWEYYEERYPYELIEAVLTKNSVNQGTYIHLEMYRRL